MDKIEGGKMEEKFFLHLLNRFFFFEIVGKEGKELFLIRCL